MDYHSVFFGNTDNAGLVLSGPGALKPIFRPRVPKPHFPTPGPYTLFSGIGSLQNRSGKWLNISVMGVASNLHVEMVEDIA